MLNWLTNFIACDNFNMRYKIGYTVNNINERTILMNIQTNREQLTTKEELTTTEAAKVMGLDYFYVRNLLNRHSVPHYNYDGRKIWKLTDILAFKAKHYVKPTGE